MSSPSQNRLRKAGYRAFGGHPDPRGFTAMCGNCQHQLPVRGSPVAPLGDADHPHKTRLDCRLHCALVAWGGCCGEYRQSLPAGNTGNTEG